MLSNSYHPFLKAAGVGKISRDDLCLRLNFGERYVVCENDSYVMKNSSTDAQENIKKNQRGGIDTEDRIKKFRAWIKNFWSD